MMNQNALRGRIIANGYTQGMLAKELVMTESTFSSKMKKGSFTIAQVDRICDILHIDSPEDKCDIFLPCKSQK